MSFPFKQHSVLPGFGLTLGFTLTYLGLLVLLPLATLVAATASMSFGEFWELISAPQVVAAFKLSFGSAILAACINALFGFIVAWSLVRYTFPGRRFVDALIDIPFAMPTAISGIALTAICSQQGWIGSWVEPFGIQIAYSRIGIVVALVFIGLPFVVRTLQPALEDLDKEVEEAAESLGASKPQTFWKIIFPSVFPALAAGFTLALARALGEYGSVVFISSNLPMKTEIVPFLIVQQLEHKTSAATAIAVVMLAASFALMFCINMIQWYARRRTAGSFRLPWLFPAVWRTFRTPLAVLLSFLLVACGMYATFSEQLGTAYLPAWYSLFAGLVLIWGYYFASFFFENRRE